LRPRHTSIALLLAAAVLFSTGGAAIKAATLTAWQVASFRSGVAAAALYLLLPVARRFELRMAPAALAYAGMLLLFVLATRLTTAANAIFLQSTAPLYLLGIGPLLLREPLKPRDLGFAAGVVAGMALLFARADAPSGTAPDPALGNLLGAAAGLFWALTVASLRWLGKEGKSSLASVAFGNTMAFVLGLPMALPVERLAAGDVAVLAYLGVVQIGLAYVCVTRALEHVIAFEASAILLVEPALNPVWAWLVHGERPGAWSIAGGGVILGAIAVKTVIDERAARVARPEGRGSE
jgi:drug/metabolite transporter (DMT)-like permease